MQGKLKEISNERKGRLWGLLRWFCQRLQYDCTERPPVRLGILVCSGLVCSEVDTTSIGLIISYVCCWDHQLFVQLKLCNKPGRWSLRVVKVFQGQGNSAKKEIVDVVAHIIHLPKNWSTPKRFLLMKKNQEKSHIWPVVIYDNIWLCNCNCTDAKQWAPPLQYCHGWESAWRRKSLENKKKEKKQAKQT